MADARDDRPATLQRGSGDLLPRLLAELRRHEASLELDFDQLEETPMFGRFVILGRIGSGGMGAVFIDLDDQRARRASWGR